MEMKEARSWLTLLIGACLMTTGLPYPQGPPPSTCITMFPKHGKDLTWKTSEPSPYKIKLSSDTYTLSQNITVTIEADDGRPFRGVQISAHRKSVNTEEFVGRFLAYSPESKIQLLSCMRQPMNQAAHKNNNDVTKVELVWQAPSENLGDLVFKMNIVEHFQSFWARETKDITSAAPGPVVPPAELIEYPAVGMDDIDFSGCGTSKGCFFYPKHCSGSECEAALTFAKNGDKYRFEMMAKAPGFVSFGLSEDNMMGVDHTVTCTATESSGSVQTGFNPEYYNVRYIPYNMTNLKVKKTDTTIMCTFDRPRILDVLQYVPNSNPPEFKTILFDLQMDWHLIMAWGHTPTDTDVMGKHTSLPVVSERMVNFESFGTYRGSSMGRERQAHAALMVVAWILFAGMATVIARHYKHLFSGKIVLGTKAWFQAHRAVAVTAFLLTAISFIIIFVKIQALVQGAALNHAIVGITVGVAVTLQVLAGMLRPGLESKIRPVFNWGHMLWGQSTHILAAVNIMLAFNMAYIPSSMNRFGTIVVAVWMGVQVLWEVAFEIASCMKSSKGGGDISDPKGMSIQQGNKGSSGGLSQVMLFIYVLTLIGFTAAVLCAIFLF